MKNENMLILSEQNDSPVNHRLHQRDWPYVRECLSMCASDWRTSRCRHRHHVACLAAGPGRWLHWQREFSY